MEISNYQGKSNSVGRPAPENNLLHTIVNELRAKYDYEKILQEATKKFQIKQYNILSLNTEKVLQIYQVLNNKFYVENSDSEFNDQWFDNELRLFIWLFVCYCYVYKKSPDEITKKEWNEFNYVFKGKQPYLFEYQSKVIRLMNKKSKKWSGQEDQHLSYIITGFNTLLESIQPCKWSEVAKKLFIESNKKYFRTPKQCRERWMNHLDPLKVKSKWAPSEDLFLMTMVLQQGKKWALISKAMGNIRTEHMVKNRYNSLLRAEMKKYDDGADETKVIKKLISKIRYNIQSKNNNKVEVELKKKAQNIEYQACEKMEDDGLNKILAVEHQEKIDQVFDDILDALKKQEPAREEEVMQQWEWEQNIEQIENNVLNIGFQFEPTFFDYI